MKRILALGLLAACGLEARKFYSDDPIQAEPPPRSVTQIARRRLNDYYDLFLNTFFSPAERNTKINRIPARGVNTLGEVPNSAWYTNRHERSPMTLDELARGPGNSNPPSGEGKWKIVSAKSQGITPGFVILDSRGVRYFLKFDPVTNPEMSTGADVIGSKFFYALGYNVPENYIVNFDRDRLLIDSKTKFTDEFGKKRSMAERDVDEILLQVPRDLKGRYRAVASLAIAGEPIGEFRYHGTRMDDPNDVVSHEHRRDLRGLFVFCAWLGHDDSRSINTFDALIEENGARYIKHYLIDFGSILGSASTTPNSARSGNQHLFAFRPAAAQLFSFGLYVPTWARAEFPSLPGVGRFRYIGFDPEQFKTEYPNPAFVNRLPDDTFWAAKQVMAFTDDEIRTIVKTAEYSDERAESWIVKCLIERRNQIGRVYFSKVLPLDNFRVERGELRFDDLAAHYGLRAPVRYGVTWAAFDNETEQSKPIEAAKGPELPRYDGEYLETKIQGEANQSVSVYLRRSQRGWNVVGLERTWETLPQP